MAKNCTFMSCIRCGTSTLHTQLCESDSDVQFWDANEYLVTEPATYSAHRCNGCLQISLYIWSSVHNPGSKFGEQVFPSLQMQDIGFIPKNVLHAYHQAEQVKLKSNTAYAILARKVLEAIAYDQEPDCHNFSQAISKMITRRGIPSYLSESTTLIRKFGNIAAHSSEPITGTHMQLIEKFLNALIEYLYTAPGDFKIFKIMLSIENPED